MKSIIGLPIAALSLITLASCTQEPAKKSDGGKPTASSQPSGSHRGARQHVKSPLHDPREKHLQNIRQLTFGGENAEGYFNSAGTKIIFQARGGDTKFDCDQIFEYDLATQNTRLISTGKGRTTCAYYHDGDKRILYASTHLQGDDCPPEPDRSLGYVWPLYPSYEIFSCPTGDPSQLIQLTDTPGYDAEATTCYANNRIVFTSTRDGDIELYSMNGDGSNVKRLTNRLGYDGGAFFSTDGKWLVWRAYEPQGEDEIREYKELLAKNLVKPSKMEIFVAKSDGSEAVQITKTGNASFAPYFFPDSKRILFASNIDGPRLFHIYAIDRDGKNRERITYSSVFNSFPMFSPDGKHVIFASNRANKKAGETNLFLAEWVD